MTRHCGIDGQRKQAGRVDASSPCPSVRTGIGLRRVSVPAGDDHLGGAVVPALRTLPTVTWRSCWLSDAARPCRHAPGDRWFVDEAYVKVTGG
jgi:hypothetical protein